MGDCPTICPAMFVYVRDKSDIYKLDTDLDTTKFWNSFPDLNSYNLMNDYGAHKRLLDYSSFFIISSCYNSLLTLNLNVWR